MPDQPPIWIKTFASQELDEMQKVNQTIFYAQKYIIKFLISHYILT